MKHCSGAIYVNSSRTVRTHANTKVHAIAGFQERSGKIQHASKNGFCIVLVYTHAPLPERVVSGFCIMGTSDTGEPILGSVELYITEDDYNGMPHDNTFIWFSKFAAWASNPLQGKQGLPMPRLQRQ